MDRTGQAPVSGERVALRAHGVQHQELPVLPPQPRQQSGAQEGGLARARRSQDHEQRLDAGAAHCAAHPGPGRSARPVRRTPPRPPPRAAPTPGKGAGPDPAAGAREMLRPDPGPTQTLMQPLQALGGKTTAILAVNGDLRCGSVCRRGRSAATPGDAALIQGLEPDAQDQLAQVLRGPVLGQAFAGSLPVGREQADHRLAPLVGPEQRLLPPFTGGNTRHRIQIQENLLARPGSCSASHRFNAIASRASLLE
jgi:hypothetical protein